jgi:hypothetical protein
MSSVEDLTAMMDCLLAPHETSLDPNTPTVPLNRTIIADRSPIRIGYFTNGTARPPSGKSYRHHIVVSCLRLETHVGAMVFVSYAVYLSIVVMGVRVIAPRL